MNRRLLILGLLVALSPACAATGASPAPTTSTATTAAPTTTVTQTTAPATTAPAVDPTVPGSTTPRVKPATPLDTDTATVEVVDDLAAQVFYPLDGGPWPVVVFFHGGSWYGGDPASTAEFARTIAGQGAVVYNATYLVGQAGGGYPHSYEDVYCALAAASATAADFGGDGPLVVAGHSAGAHLAATVTMAGDRFATNRCTHRADVTVGGFVGIAGPYDTVAIGAFMAPWFGGSPVDVPEAWEEGNPQAYLGEPRFPVLLIHGSGDRLVPLTASEVFAALAEAAGWDVEIYVIPAATHGDVIDPIGDGRETAAKIVQFADTVSGG